MSGERIGDRECGDLTMCSQLEIEVTPPTATSDRVCREFSDAECSLSQFISHGGVDGGPAICSELTACTDGEF